MRKAHSVSQLQDETAILLDANHYESQATLERRVNRAAGHRREYDAAKRDLSAGNLRWSYRSPRSIANRG